VWSKSDEGVLRRGTQARVRPRSAAGADVRQGGSQVRHTRPARGRARPRLRAHTQPRRAVPRSLLTQSRHGLPHAATARGHGPRYRHASGRKKGLRHHGRRTEVPGGKPALRRRHLGQVRRRLGPAGRLRDVRGPPRPQGPGQALRPADARGKGGPPENGPHKGSDLNSRKGNRRHPARARRRWYDRSL
ncbi:Transcriptional regulator, PadR family, partial [uncultured Rubrobacteraceae bacterium]